MEAVVFTGRRKRNCMFILKATSRHARFCNPLDVAGKVFKKLLYLLFLFNVINGEVNKTYFFGIVLNQSAYFIIRYRELWFACATEVVRNFYGTFFEIRVKPPSLQIITMGIKYTDYMGLTGMILDKDGNWMALINS